MPRKRFGIGFARRGGGAAAVPEAFPGSLLSFVAHPTYTASDASHLVPCGEGDTIRWWQDAVSGTWYEQAANAPTLARLDGRWVARTTGAQHFDVSPISFGFGIVGVCGTIDVAGQGWWEIGVGFNSNTHSFLEPAWTAGDAAYAMGPPGRLFFAAPEVPLGERKSLIVETTAAYLRMLTDGVETQRTTAAAVEVTGTYLRLFGKFGTLADGYLERFALVPPAGDVAALNTWLLGS